MADKKTTQLNAATSLSLTDLFMIVADVGTSPVNKKIAWSTIMTMIYAYLPPTLYSSSVDSKGGVYNGDFEIGTGSQSNTSGWIGAEQYGWFLLERITGGTATASYDNTVSRKGTQSMKLDVNLSGTQAYRLTNLPGVDGGESYTPLTEAKQKYLFPAKPSTVYKVTIYAKTQITSATSGFIFNVREHSASLGNVLASQSFTSITTTQDFTQIQKVFTTNASSSYLSVDLTASTVVGTIWIDSIQIQEVSPLTPTNTLPETMGGIFQAQNSTAIDQSQLNTNEVRAFGNNTRNIIAQQFTVSKTKQYGVTIYKAGNTGTFVNDVIASIQSDSGSDTPSGTVLSKITIPNATWNSYATGDPIRIVFPYIVTPGVKYWVTLEQTTPDASNYPAIQSNNPASSYAGGLLKGYLPSTWTTIDADLKFFTEYSRLSEGMTLVSNGIETNLMASSKDGLLGGSILDLDNGKWKYDSGTLNSSNLTNVYNWCANVYSAGQGGSGGTFLNRWAAYGSAIGSGVADTPLVMKIDTILPIKHLKVGIKDLVNAGANYLADMYFSPDNIVYTPIYNSSGGDNTLKIVDVPDSLTKNLSQFYIKILPQSGKQALFSYFSIEADIDTSSIPLPTIYPLAINQFNVPIKTSTAPARAYYRLNKYVNENNVMMPAIELTDSSGNPLGFGCVKQDNSQEASPCCKLLPTSTGYTGSGGTGSFDATGCILNDGEYMPITGTNYNFEIDYQLGTGTTAISAITKNIAYLSSNSQLADSTLDASLMANFFLSVKQQGLATAIGDVREDIQEVKGGLTVVNNELDRLDGTMFVQTADKTIGNTDVETSLFDGGLGSRVLPSQSLKVGDTVRMRLMGYVSGTNGDASTIKVKVGASELVASTSNFPATVTGVFVEFLFEFTVRSIGSAGTVIGQGRTMFNASVGFGTSTIRGLQMVSGAVALDTTKDNLIDITYTWGTARVGNTLTITNAIVDIKKQ